MIFIILVLSVLEITIFANYENIACTDTIRQAAKNSSGTKDIFDNREILIGRRNIEWAREVLDDALVHVRTTASPNLSAELAALHPNYSGCAWLEVEVVERAGLGHSFAAWLKYLKDAVVHNLTYHASFYTSASHDFTCDLNETAHFFGLHSTFFWARKPPASAKRVDIGKDYTGCSSANISSAVSAYRRTNGQFSCSRGHVVFFCYNRHEPFRERITGSAIGALPVVRGPFLSAYRRIRPRHIHPLLRDTSESDVIQLAVHIRRGDIFRSRRVDKEHRLVSYKIYTNVIKLLLKERNDNPETRRSPVLVSFLCEGAGSSHTVRDYHEHNVKASRQVNVTEELADVCNSRTLCKSQVLWDADFYQSFVAMCDSDVLVTSTSGYAWTASTLCAPALTVSFPWGSTYEGLENVVPVSSSGPLWSSRSSAFLANASFAWSRMVKIRRKRRLVLKE